MENNVYEKYALIKGKIAELTEEAESLNAVIIADMNEKGIDKDDESTSLGKFSIAKYKKWTYTEPTQALADELKGIQAKEQSTGDAMCTETDSLRFTAIKI